MKILFISSRDVHLKATGGELGTSRNYLSLSIIAGKENIDIIDLSENFKKSFKKNIKRFFNYFLGFCDGMNHYELKKILKTAPAYDVVFIDGSNWGAIAKRLKKAKYPGKIIIYFHNVESELAWQKFKRKPISFWKYLLFYYNEKSTFLYSDVRLVVNQRDAKNLQKSFGHREILIMPVSLQDNFKRINNQNLTSSEPVYLFIGSSWPPNVLGIKWFVTNVLASVKIKLQIVGKGMESLKGKFNDPAIEVFGFIDDISEIMSKADFIISPIFGGSGMKVKTCDALMHGKNIIGTTEAFEGYDLDFSKVGAVCNSKEDFIMAINNFIAHPVNRFNEYSRSRYLENYSFDVTLKIFQQALKE